MWSDKWLLKFHPEKCKVMHLGKADNTKYFYKLKEGGTHHELAYTEEEKDLGVVIDGKLDFEKHINININKACGIMAVIRRSFVSLNCVNFVPLYKSLVRSHLEYASCTVKPLYSEQSRDPKKCSLYRGVHPRGVRYVHVHMCLQYTRNGSVLASKGFIRW